MDPLDPTFRIAELDVANHAPEDRIVGLFRFENAGNTKTSPTLLILAEIHSTLYIYERLLDVINATAESARYLVAGVDQDPVGRFEKLVERLNEAVAHFVASEGTPVSWGRVNICVAELSKGHICFTGMGTLTNLFLQKQDDGSFRGFDILGSLEQPAQPDPQKPFAALVCGDIKPGDILLIGSGNLERLRGELHLKERLSTLPPVTAALEIKQDLENRGIPDHFVAGIITCHETKPVAEPPLTRVVEVVKSTSSIEELRASEAEVNEHLSPVISPVHTKTPEELVKALRSRFDGFVQSIQGMVGGNTPNGGQRRPPDAMRLMSLRGMNAGYGSVFTKQRKNAILAGVAGIIIIFGGAWYWKYTQRKAAENTAWIATFEQATDNRNKAESDLIYGNEGRARSELASAEQGIAALPTDNADRTNKIEGLKKEINDLKERLKKITVATGVQELTVLSPGTAEGSLLAPIVSKNGRAYTLDTSSHSLISVDIAKKEVKRINLPEGATPITATEGTAGIIVLTTNGLYSVSKTDDSVSPLTANQLQSSSTKDIVLYASRLYSLDAGQNQIWRSQKTDSGFGTQSAYIKAANTSLADAIAMAIDSNVYVLKSNGTLVRFLSGGQEGFALAPVDPPLTNATGLFTDIDTTSVYIADPTGKRVLVFDKTGSLKSQITAPEFNAPRDVSVDEANKRMIVADGNRLLLVPLP